MTLHQAKMGKAYKKYREIHTEKPLQPEVYSINTEIIGCRFGVDFEKASPDTYRSIMEISDIIYGSLEKEWSIDSIIETILGFYPDFVHYEENIREVISETSLEMLIFKHNDYAQPMTLNYEYNPNTYGTSPTSPVRLGSTRIDSDIYIKSLKTMDGEDLIWARRGSSFSHTLGVPCDVYVSYRKGGYPYRMLYTTPYVKTNRKYIPFGFKYK